MSQDKIIIFDTTLRDGEQSPGATMNLSEKLRVARQLELMGVDVIEAGFPASSPGDFEAVSTIAEKIRGVQVAGLARALESDIDRAWEAVRRGEDPRIHLFVATSPVHMKYKLRKEPEQVLRMARDAVAHAAKYTSNVEFSAEDASRSDPAFLARVVEAAIDAGATTINIPDTVGYAQPAEFAGLIRYLLEHVKNADKAIFSVHCHNDLGMALANTLAAIGAGARQAEVCINGIGERAGNAALEELVMALDTRRDIYGVDCSIVTQQLYPASKLLSGIIGQPLSLSKPVVGQNAFAHESGIHQDGVLKRRETYEIMDPAMIGRNENEIVLGKHSGRNAIKTRLVELGYELTDEEVGVVFNAVKALADKKRQIHDEDLRAVVLEEVYRIPDKYRLVSLSVQSGSTGVPPVAAIALEIDGRHKEHVCFGKGPVDAVFSGLAHLTGVKPNLLSYTVNAVTGGTDAQGEVTVRLEVDGKTAVGRGAHNDVITASARAFLNALNRATKDQPREVTDDACA